MNTRVSQIRHHGGRAVSVVADSEGGQHGVPGLGGHLVHAAVRAGAGHGPAGPARGARGRRRPGLPGLPDRGPGGARRTRWRGTTTGSTSTTPASSTMRIQNFGSWSPYLVKDGRNVLGLEYTVDEGDESWTRLRRGPDRAGQGRARHGWAWSTRPRSRPATWCACPRRIPYYDTDYKANVDVHPGLAGGQRGQRVPGRPQRDAPLQQPGPLDVHGHADGREPPRCRPRRVVGQRRGGVPRDRRAARSAGDRPDRVGRAPGERVATPRSCRSGPAGPEDREGRGRSVRPGYSATGTEKLRDSRSRSSGAARLRSGRCRRATPFRADPRAARRRISAGWPAARSLMRAGCRYMVDDSRIGWWGIDVSLG